MPTRKFALERGGPKQLQIRWRRGFKDFEVALDGQAWKVDRSGVEGGTSITLPGGSSLFVQRVRRRWWSIALRDDLRVERDGVPVPGSDGDARVIGRRAASVIALFGLLRVLFVGLWIVFSSGGAAPAGPGAFIAADGVVLIVLAVLAGLGMRLPVALAAGLLAVELVASIALTGGRPSGVGTIIQVLVIAHLVHSWRRMRPSRASPSLASVFE